MQQKRGCMGIRRRRMRSILLPLLLAAAAGCILYLYSIQITSYTVSGNEEFSAQEIITGIFPGEKPPGTVEVFLKSVFGKQTEVPFLEAYEIIFQDWNTITITVREQQIVGCLDYGGRYLYFSKTGTLLKQTEEKKDYIPIYLGVLPKTIQKYRQIETDREGIFEKINQMSQLLKQYDLQIERVGISLNDEITLYFGNVKAALGDFTCIEEKVAQLYGMYEQLKDMDGTLYLDTYNPDLENQEFHFKKNS